MRIWIVAGLMFGLGNIAFADTPKLADGFYINSKDPAVAESETEDGRKVRVGKKVDLDVTADLLAGNILNDKFHLRFKIPYDPKLDTDTYILAFKGKLYHQNSIGSSQKKTSIFSYKINGLGLGQELSKIFRTPLLLERHPGHELLGVFKPVKKEYLINGSVVVEWAITNVGDKLVRFYHGGANRGARDNQYTFSAQYNSKGVLDIGDYRHRGGMSREVVLKPGMTFVDHVELNKWFKFDKSGLYRVHGSYHMKFPGKRGEDLHLIWSDYLSADFSIHVRE